MHVHQAIKIVFSGFSERLVNADAGIINEEIEGFLIPFIDDQVSSAFDVGQADTELIGALERLFDLVDRPQEAKVMTPLLVREIHFRILMARHGGLCETVTVQFLRLLLKSAMKVRHSSAENMRANLAYRRATI